MIFFEKLAADKDRIDVGSYGFSIIIDIALTLFSLGFRGRLEKPLDGRLAVDGT